MSGVIKLLYNKEVNRFSSYPSPSVRDKTIAGWKKVIGKLFDKMELIDEPDENMRGRYERIKESQRFKKGPVQKSYASPEKKAIAYRMSHKN